MNSEKLSFRICSIYIRIKTLVWLPTKPRGSPSKLLFWFFRTKEALLCVVGYKYMRAHDDNGSFTSKLTHCRSIWLTFLPKRLLAIWIGEWTVYVYTLYPSSTPARIYLNYSLYQPWSPQFTVKVDFYLLAIMARHLAFAGCNYGLVLIHSCIFLNFC